MKLPKLAYSTVVLFSAGALAATGCSAAGGAQPFGEGTEVQDQAQQTGSSPERACEEGHVFCASFQECRPIEDGSLCNACDRAWGVTDGTHVYCDDSCTLTTLDRGNCGACGNVCQGADICENGQCGKDSRYPASSDTSVTFGEGCSAWNPRVFDFGDQGVPGSVSIVSDTPLQSIDCTVTIDFTHEPGWTFDFEAVRVNGYVDSEVDMSLNVSVGGASQSATQTVIEDFEVAVLQVGDASPPCGSTSARMVVHIGSSGTPSLLSVDSLYADVSYRRCE